MENMSAIISLLQTIAGICFLAAIGFIMYKNMRKGSKESVMALEVVPAAQKNTKLIDFSQVAGNEDAKNKVYDIVDYIKNPDKYNKYGARIPRGVIFYGPPGTGKTMLAKAVAGEAGVDFYAVTGSDFVQMYVGVGAMRIRQLFKKVRQSGKAVVFIDEIDAIGKKRSNANTSGNDERDQTLNALLTEMSGFNDTDGVVIIAATNRIDILDEALTRTGRFDRHVEIGLPNINQRKKIIDIHFKGKPVSDDVNFDELAKQTVFFSGAMLEGLINEAAILAAKQKSEFIENKHIEESYYTMIAGSPADKSLVKRKDINITACHEAGHAVVTKIVLPENEISKITVIPSTNGNGGFVLSIPPDKMYYTKKDIEGMIMSAYAGRAAEEVIFGKDCVTTGAQNDIQKATSIIKDYIFKYGMFDEFGLIGSEYEKDGLMYLKKVSYNLYNKTVEIVKNNKEVILSVADELIEKETIYSGRLDEIINNMV